MTISKTEGLYVIMCTVFSVFEALFNHVYDKFSINKGYHTLLSLLLSYYLVITS